MELEFMKYIDYSLLVKEKEYVAWVRWLEMFIRIVMNTHDNDRQSVPSPTYSYGSEARLSR
jgi:hypothetical protein